MNVLITGAAGYIGTMLVDQFAYSTTIERLICIDIKERSARFRDHPRVRWIRADVAEDEWASVLRNEPIDEVIHCAYQIRELDGRGRDRQRRWNIEGARKVFEFALGHASVRRLVQLSTITAYGALATNSLDRSFTEEMPLSEDAYLYGVQKKQVEDLLWQTYRRVRPSTHVVVLRLASVSGPRGRFGLNRYGLLSTIAGGFPALICGRSDWGRQYLHEDDLIAVLSMLVHLPPADGYQVYNVSPADFLDAAKLGRLFDKRVVVLPPALLRSLFFSYLAWYPRHAGDPARSLENAHLSDSGRRRPSLPGLRLRVPLQLAAGAGRAGGTLCALDPEAAAFQQRHGSIPALTHPRFLAIAGDCFLVIAGVNRSAGCWVHARRHFAT